ASLAGKVYQKLYRSEGERRNADDPGKQSGTIAEISALPQRETEEHDDDKAEDRSDPRALGVEDRWARQRGLYHRQRRRFAFATLFDDRIENPDENDDENNQHAGAVKPRPTVVVGREKQPVFRQRPQDESEQQRRTRPFQFLQHPAERAEEEHDQHVLEGVFFGEGAEIHEDQDQRYE